MAIIGGTGIGESLLRGETEAVTVETVRGVLHAERGELDGCEVVLVRRHAAGHFIPPHRVPYAAMALGLKALGVEVCLASAAVGSLRADWGTGTLAVCDGFIDMSSRNLTLFEDEVQHTDFTSPFGALAREGLLGACRAEGLAVQERAVYVCTNGPRYETPQEIEAYRRLGGDVIGMTAASEAVLMREAGIDYGCLAVVTNLAAGLAGERRSHAEVEAAMRASAGSVVAVLARAAKELSCRR